MEKKIRIATLGIADEMRSMEIGDMVRFPFERYTYNSVRVAPSSTLVPERANGKRWRCRINYEEKSTDVTRIA